MTQSSRSFNLSSPDKNIEVNVEVANQIRYSLKFGREQIVEPSALSLTIEKKGTLGQNPDLMETDRRIVDDIIRPVIKEKNAEIAEQYNELRLQFQGDYEVILRAYNDGVAYRFITDFDEEIIRVIYEQVELNFTDDYDIYFPQEKTFMTQFEKGYKRLALSRISTKQFCNTPALVDIANGPKVLISEADLEDYAGLYLQGTGSASLTGKFPYVATKEELKTDRDLFVTERANYIAETSGSRVFPWRMLVLAESDGALVENQLVYKLGRPLQLEDTTWIEPGKAAWDGWNPGNVFDVDFKVGYNMPTYKYYVDFAAKMNLEYFIVDEGWYEQGDLLNPKPHVDIPELIEYGKKKGVDIILWVIWKTLEDQWEPAFKQFEEWGIKGLKVDFMQRDDQWMVNWFWKIAKEAARRKMLVEFHASYNPKGLRRAYPNVISREGVKGLEQVKGLEHNHPNYGKDITPEHNVTIPFTRMPAGPMDYTPGAMTNARKENYRIIFNRPMSQGTRCHQLAMYVVYESPLQMLADSPAHYLEQKDDILKYLSEVPSTWDETRVLKAKIGDYLLLGRRKENRWYIGGMTDELARNFKIQLSFLSVGTYTAEIYNDGINADRYAEDYHYSIEKVTADSKLKVQMEAGGGWVAVFTPAE